MADFPPPVTRPDGRLYQPLKVSGHAVDDEARGRAGVRFEVNEVPGA